MARKQDGGLYQRGEIWWVRIVHQGREIRKSTGTTNRVAAEEWRDQLKASLWRQVKLGERPEYRWEEAVEKWFGERIDRPAAYNWRLTLRWLHPHLHGTKLVDITRERIENIKKAKQREGVKPRTVNDVLNVVRSVLRAAHEWEWIDRVPVVKTMAEPARRVRFLTETEETRLIQEVPQHVKPIVRFALCTGLRMSNILSLEWSQIDMARRVAWIHPDQAKARKAIPVPLNSDAATILREQMGQHLTHVFSYRGEPLLRVNGRAWREAVARAGVENFTFHCLRHTWASRHIQSGTSLHALMEMGGWSDVDMVRKYAHFGAEHLVEHAERIARSAQNPAHNEKATG
ncbi:tyrosine-type recombinase/integrase [Chitiniphilus eburneus]|uniref:Site-specific integrase n=1 Tax=Chitiniphilus eburneus TaxID=2571148 RepID=A0A4U0Q4I5_9NEIS|nr:site-specific integrase [Chitiniphilus eburneus]TJZ75620.1 site-specific integrase [Chitiniphilus eburneus]